VVYITIVGIQHGRVRPVAKVGAVLPSVTVKS
jgi:hypothetical protein